MKDTKTNITIITGLPGSGKTTLANEMFKENFAKGVEMVHLDDFRNKSLEEIVKEKLQFKNKCKKNCIFEGLLLTNKDLSDFINAIKEYRSDFDVTVHYFREDRETCLYNDIGRREKYASVTIRNAKYEEPDANYIKEQTGVSIKKEVHNVVPKSSVDMFYDIKGVRNRNQLTSCSWSLGGTYGSCWGNELSHITPDKTPEFAEFDELLEKLCPNITFMQYKKLYRSCVTTNEESVSDYYGGCEYRANYVCDLKQLYYDLEEMGLVNVEEMIEEEKMNENEEIER